MGHIWGTFWTFMDTFETFLGHFWGTFGTLFVHFWTLFFLAFRTFFGHLSNVKSEDPNCNIWYPRVKSFFKYISHVGYSCHFVFVFIFVFAFLFVFVFVFVTFKCNAISRFVYIYLSHSKCMLISLFHFWPTFELGVGQKTSGADRFGEPKNQISEL